MKPDASNRATTPNAMADSEIRERVRWRSTLRAASFTRAGRMAAGSAGRIRRTARQRASSARGAAALRHLLEAAVERLESRAQMRVQEAPVHERHEQAAEALPLQHLDAARG